VSQKLIALGLVAACAGTDEGVFTESVCPPTDPPTYATFGQVFMESYCTECHDAAKTGAMRQDAPATIDFDTLAQLRMWTSQIDKQAAFGPAAMNRLMPPAGNPRPTEPSDDERRRLGEFIACEVGR
jgi:uncharacterized membrane protein